MGLDYSYLLYFKRKHLWEALQGVAAIAEPHQPPTVIQFPDHELAVPLDSWLLRDKTVYHDDPEFSFSIVLNFEEDDEILDYIIARDRGRTEVDRSPPDEQGTNLVPIGYIYLDIYNDLSRRITIDEPSDLVLFDFGTTGTRMSLLFSYSTSIREAFADLLDRCHGVCGVFNREDGGGELFWLAGRRMSDWIEDPYLTPEEIDGLARKYRW
jgi:hypothetical protein